MLTWDSVADHACTGDLLRCCCVYFQGCAPSTNHVNHFSSLFRHLWKQRDTLPHDIVVGLVKTLGVCLKAVAGQLLEGLPGEELAIEPLIPLLMLLCQQFTAFFETYSECSLQDVVALETKALAAHFIGSGFSCDDSILITCRAIDCFIGFAHLTTIDSIEKKQRSRLLSDLATLPVNWERCALHCLAVHDPVLTDTLLFLRSTSANLAPPLEERFNFLHWALLYFEFIEYDVLRILDAICNGMFTHLHQGDHRKCDAGIVFR